MKTLDELITAWNSQADAYNTWANLGEDEIVDFAQRVAIAAERERCAKLCEQEHRESGEHPEMALHCAERIRGVRA